jgi:trans-aconitate 2-methyltransferase
LQKHAKRRIDNGRLEPFSLPAIWRRKNASAAELLARVPLDEAATIADLGCGPGNSTALLKHRWPSAHITGVDNSPAMLEEARAALPDCHFVEADIRQYTPGQPLSLIYANASLQWIPDHYDLLPHLVSCLS